MVPFDWYYFDISGDNGNDLVVIYHTHPFTSEFPISLVDVFWYEQGHLQWHYFYPLPITQLKVTPRGFSWDETNSVAYANHAIQLQAMHQQFHLQFTMKQPLLTPIPVFELLVHATPEHYFRWEVRQPHAAAEAHINFQGKQYHLRGKGYHDRNFGTIYLAQALRSWRWAKLYFEDALVILGEIVDAAGQKKIVGLQITADGLKKDQDFLLEWQPPQIRVNARFGNWTLETISRIQLDDIYFYLPTGGCHWVYYHRVRELLNFYSQQYGFTWLQQRNATAHYQRFRQTYLFKQKRVKGFLEEMTFGI